MRNKYGGDCYRCGKWVAPKEGYFEKIWPSNRAPDGPRWQVWHRECCLAYRKEKFGPDATIGGRKTR